MYGSEATSCMQAKVSFFTTLHLTAVVMLRHTVQVTQQDVNIYIFTPPKLLARSTSVIFLNGLFHHNINTSRVLAVYLA